MKKEHKIILICFALVCVLGVLLAIYLDSLPKSISREVFVQNVDNATTIRTKSVNSYWGVSISGKFANEDIENLECDLVVNEKGYVANDVNASGINQIVAMTQDAYNDILSYLNEDGLKEEYSKKGNKVFASLKNMIDGEVVEIKFTMDLSQGYLANYINTKEGIDVSFSLLNPSVNRKMFLLKINECATTRKTTLLGYSNAEVSGTYKNSTISGEEYNLAKIDDKYYIENIQGSGDNFDIELDSAYFLNIFRDLGASFKERYIVSDNYVKGEFFNVVTTDGVAKNVFIKFEFDVETGLLKSYSNTQKNFALEFTYIV